MSRRRSRVCSRRWLIAGLAAGLLLVAAGGATPALAQGPWWHIDSRSAPSTLSPGGEGEIVVSASNLGDTEALGSEHPITITDHLPARLTATSISGRSNYPEELPMNCSPQTLSCTYATGLLPYKRLEVMITVKVAPGPSAVEGNQVTVEGGGAPSPPALAHPVLIGGEATSFGVEHYALGPENEGGPTDTQAGSHPFQLTTTLDLNQTLEPGRFGKSVFPQAPALVKDLQFHLPPGVIGNPTATARCSDVDFSTIAQDGLTNLCPPDSAVGVAEVTIYEPVFFPFITAAVPVFNLEPERGEPARFGFEAFKVPVVLDTEVKSSEGYGVVVSVRDASQAAAILGSQVTLWGEPQAQSHDKARGWACLDLPPEPERGALKNCHIPGEHSSEAFLTLPTSCPGTPLQSTVEGDSWPTVSAPGGDQLTPVSALLETLQGCDQLPFNPAIEVQPDQNSASTPSGMTAAVKVPQQPTLDGGQLGEADVKNSTITLPEGVQLSPGAATGLLACTGAQVGLSPGIEERLQIDNQSSAFSEGPPNCPEQAKVATVTVKTPLLDHELHGTAYLASQDTNPFASPLVLYLLVEDPVTGIQLKLAGSVSPNPDTGQLTSTFQNTPQLPFEELKLHFFDGPRASLSTPPLCGSYSTTGSFTPWSRPTPASVSSSFQVGAGAEGAPCTDPQPFASAFNAQSQSPEAGAFTSFTLNIAHRDRDQALSGLTMRLPRGMAAILASVTPCPEPQADRGECSQQSLVGHTSANSGFGPEPFNLNGQVFLTGPYAGAPFGLSIVTPAVAGPFNLGKVIVRSAINVDPYTAAVTITGALPTIVQTAAAGKTGIPVQLKELKVTIDRPGFEFNPTNCSAMSVSGTLTGAQDASDNVASNFQMTGCTLPFKPKLVASTLGKTSKARGAALRVKVTSPGMGQENVAKTSVTLPAVLPARLSTLQKACVARLFEANPASCPESSNIGTATIHTPVFKDPLAGPAYLVSHGNVAYPDVEFVLQGEGLEIILDGKTIIKHNVTTSSFEALPDAPFTSFETSLPEGPHSVLTANGNLCTEHLTMPTTITAQNGSVIKQNTNVAVEGCVKAKRLTRAQKLARALRACRKTYKVKHARRLSCERKMRKRYGAAHAKKSTKTIDKTTGTRR